MILFLILRQDKPAHQIPQGLLRLKRGSPPIGLHQRSVAVLTRPGLKLKSKQETLTSRLRQTSQHMNLPQETPISQNARRRRSHSRAAKSLCGNNRSRRQHRTGKVFVGLSTLYPLGSGMPMVSSPGTAPHFLLKTASGQRETLHGRQFPTASAGSRRPAREQRLWGGSPGRL